MFCCSHTNSVCSYCDSLNKGCSASKIAVITSCVTCCYAVLEHARTPIEEMTWNSSSAEKPETTHPPVSLIPPHGWGALWEDGSAAASCSLLAAQRPGRAGPGLRLATRPPPILIPKRDRKALLKIEAKKPPVCRELVFPEEGGPTAVASIFGRHFSGFLHCNKGATQTCW